MTDLVAIANPAKYSPPDVSSASKKFPDEIARGPPRASLFNVRPPPGALALGCDRHV